MGDVSVGVRRSRLRIGACVVAVAMASACIANDEGERRRPDVTVPDQPERRQVDRLSVVPGVNSAFAFASFEPGDGPYDVEDAGRSAASRRLVEVLPNGDRVSIDLSDVLPADSWSTLIDVDSTDTSATLLFRQCLQSGGLVPVDCMLDTDYLLVVVEDHEVVASMRVAFPEPAVRPTGIAVDDTGETVFLASGADAALAGVLWAVSMKDGTVTEVPGTRVSLDSARSCPTRDGSLIVVWSDPKGSAAVSFTVLSDGSRQLHEVQLGPVIDVVCGPTSALVVGYGGSLSLAGVNETEVTAVPQYAAGGALEWTNFWVVPAAEPTDTIVVARQAVAGDSVREPGGLGGDFEAKSASLSDAVWRPASDDVAEQQRHRVVVKGSVISLEDARWGGEL